ncbi:MULTISPECIES: hypothetical protein [unclassified Haladaptatus]|uniref:hypothetical protein n=1 Tax=unclassified Haladaptatus TaxID=2622732 RepID=UPI0023E83BC1|nr:MULTISPECIES: hypothetical protein [unclassified Haladaptatus]
MPLEVLVTLVAWVAILGLLVLLPWLAISAVGGAIDAFEPRPKPLPVDRVEPIDKPAIADGSGSAFDPSDPHPHR